MDFFMVSASGSPQLKAMESGSDLIQEQQLAPETRSPPWPRLFLPLILLAPIQNHHLEPAQIFFVGSILCVEPSCLVGFISSG